MLDQIASSIPLPQALIAKGSGKTCSGTLTIDVGKGTVEVTTAPTGIVNGDKVVWEVKMTDKGKSITSYGLVEIKLSYSSPLLSVPSPSSPAGTPVQVDILEEEDPAKSGSHVDYTVYHNGALLKWDTATPAPYLVIDHIGEPPPKPFHHHGGHHRNRRNAE
jgi:hypothetical protein